VIPLMVAGMAATVLVLAVVLVTCRLRDRPYLDETGAGPVVRAQAGYVAWRINRDHEAAVEELPRLGEPDQFAGWPAIRLAALDPELRRDEDLVEFLTQRDRRWLWQWMSRLVRS
jgi:hypothetical protein